MTVYLRMFSLRRIYARRHYVNVFSRKTLSNGSKSIALESVYSFDDIPGPKVSQLGDYDGTDTVKFLQKLHDDYGDIVKLDIPTKRPIVFLYSTSLYRSLSSNEGEWPVREASACQVHYAKNNRNKHGLVTRQGKDWRELRNLVTQPLGNRRIVNSYVKSIDEVSSEFVGRMRQLRDPNSFMLPNNFKDQISRWALETICMVAFGHRVGGLDSGNDDAEKMIAALSDMFALLYELDNLPVEASFDSPQFERYVYTMDTILGIADKFMNAAMHRSACNSESEMSLFERLLSQMDRESAVVMLQDILAGGVDTVTNTVAKVLYLIASHPREQEKLAAELEVVLQDIDSPFTADTVDKVPYLEGVVKEAMRVFPATPGSSRTMQKDVILGGFQVPMGVKVMAVHSVMGTRPDYFMDPHRFVPERWLRNNNSGMRPSKEVRLYAFNPFGKGKRSCVAQRLARYEMLILTAKIVRAFVLQWTSGQIQMEHRCISIVKSPLNIKISDRSEPPRRL